jgi:hypothetical protein
MPGSARARSSSRSAIGVLQRHGDEAEQAVGVFAVRRARRVVVGAAEALAEFRRRPVGHRRGEGEHLHVHARCVHLADARGQVGELVGQRAVAHAAGDHGEALRAAQAIRPFGAALG